MAWDDLEPKLKKPAPIDLSPMSIDDLQNRIAEFQVEILRMQDAM